MQLNKANTKDTEVPFLSTPISKGFVFSKIYDKLDFDIVNFPFLMGKFPVVPLMERIFS